MNWHPRSLTICLFLSCAISALAQDVSKLSRGEEAGFSSERLGRITQFFQSEVDKGAIPGAVLVVARSSGPTAVALGAATLSTICVPCPRTVSTAGPPLPATMAWDWTALVEPLRFFATVPAMTPRPNVMLTRTIATRPFEIRGC